MHNLDMINIFLLIFYLCKVNYFLASEVLLLTINKIEGFFVCFSANFFSNYFEFYLIFVAKLFKHLTIINYFYF